MKKYLWLIMVAGSIACNADGDKQTVDLPEIESLLIDSFVLNPPPSILYGNLFQTIQMSQAFIDSKVFVDLRPRYSIEKIRKNADKLDQAATREVIEKFVMDHFSRPQNLVTDFVSDPNQDVLEHIQKLWPVITHNPIPFTEGSSLIPLPHQHVVSYGKSEEIIYWESYFVMLGLAAQGEWGIIRNMLDNFAFLIEQLGYIPSGNRTYYASRSNPPFFSLMVTLLAEHDGDHVLKKYYPFLQKEYEFWMDGMAEIQNPNQGYRRVVKMSDFQFLNRYWDDLNIPRDESYRDDFLLGAESDEPKKLYRNIRAASESGWDFSTRWIRNSGTDLQEIATTEIIPIDLNSLLFHLEEVLENCARLNGHDEMVTFYQTRKNYRKEQIINKCWDPIAGFFTDYNWVQNRKTAVPSAASLYPLFFKIVDLEQAERVANFAEKFMLQPGGISTTLTYSGQHWDTPYGWAPLQWIAVRGLRNYGFDTLADEIKDRWLRVNRNIFRNTGKMTDKYNIADITSSTGEGEYPYQDGHGWTNGVFVALERE